MVAIIGKCKNLCFWYRLHLVRDSESSIFQEM